MSSSSLRSALAATALLVATSPAVAVELFTPMSQGLNGQRIMCAIVNVGTSPVQVSAAVRHWGSGADISFTNVCPPPPAAVPPGESCYVQTDAVGIHTAYCHFKTSSSRVRANLIVFDSNFEILATLAATK
jgi:hypothetical protein